MKLKSKILIVIFVAINLFLFSTVSPIQTLMNMQYNEWLYYLIGKGMANGMVPYVDLVDHKGPYLFYLFALINLLPFKHIGFYIVSTIIYSCIAVVSYEMCMLILLGSYVRETLDESSYDSVISMVVAFITHMICSSYYMSFGTMSAEIVTLPFTLISYYLFLKYLLTDGENHPLKYLVVYGITAGISFFIKANAILAFVPIALYLLVSFIKNKKYKELLLDFAVGFISFVVALLPAIIYSIATNSFADMIEGAFTINILYTGTGMPSSGSNIESLWQTLIEFKEWIILCLGSIFAFNYLIKFRKHIIIFYILSLVINLYSVLMSMRPYTNYLAYLMFYMMIVILFFVKILSDIFFGEDGVLSKNKILIKAPYKRNILILSIAIIIINILSYSLTFEVSNINGVKQGTLARRVVKIYEESDSAKKTPKLLVVGYAPYLYEAFETYPNEKYFATPVVSRKVYKKPYDKIIEKIEKGDEDVVIVAFERQMLRDKEFQGAVYNALNSLYKSIGETSYLGEKMEVFVKME